jgi:hypothetical protein
MPIGGLFEMYGAFDMSEPAARDLPTQGVFAVLLGGSASTGIASTIGKHGSWVQGQVKAYMEDPVGLDGHGKI